MKCGARVAVGVVAGYFLGRTKKMKLAMMLGGMAAGRRAGGPGDLLKTGTKLLNSSPELARLTDEVRGRLLEAGKGAALAVAARQVESLTDRVGKRVESFGDVGVPRRRKKAEEPETDEYDEDEYAEDEYAEDEGAEDEGAEPDDSAEDEEETAEAPEPPPPARPRSERPAPARAGKNAAPARAGKNAATATLKRSAAPAAGAAGKVSGRRRSGGPARTQRSDSDG
ncbi:hypothetical protein [Pseudonocardia sp.]|uniref:hypothetical protein n=1 Tax=Pseudonocardia sp. TaxID=60912 RepID=UPI0031FC5EF2